MPDESSIAVAEVLIAIPAMMTIPLIHNTIG
jgi:hypothetical protein